MEFINNKKRIENSKRQKDELKALKDTLIKKKIISEIEINQQRKWKK